jgi:hypothetical protein
MRTSSAKGAIDETRKRLSMAGKTSTPDNKTIVNKGTVTSGPNKGKKATKWSDGSVTYE